MHYARVSRLWTKDCIDFTYQGQFLTPDSQIQTIILFFNTIDNKIKFNSFENILERRSILSRHTWMSPLK